MALTRERAIWLGVCGLAVWGGRADGGIAGTTGAVVVVPPPVSVDNGAYERDTEIRVFAERQQFTLTQGLEVNVTRPGTLPSGGVGNTSPGVIPAGTVVDSYFVHFDRVGSLASDATALSGTITFAENVLGVMVFDAKLDLSNGVVGLPGVNYGDTNGLEITVGGVGTGPNDQFIFSADRRTLTFNWRDQATQDQIRVLTGHLPGDTNDDGVVDLADLNNVLNNFGSNVAGNVGDENRDGHVDLADLNRVLNFFGYPAAGVSEPVGAAVPEPGGLVVVAGGVVVGRRGRRRVDAAIEV